MKPGKKGKYMLEKKKKNLKKDALERAQKIACFLREKYAVSSVYPGFRKPRSHIKDSRVLAFTQWVPDQLTPALRAAPSLSLAIHYPHLSRREGV
ncbi:MAG: hypothetical protein ACUVRM_02875, partial [Bacillota bacterium]